MVSVRQTFLTLLLGALAVPVLAAGGYADNPFVGADAPQQQKHFQEQLDVNPFDPIALNNLAVAKAEQGDIYSAQDMLQRATRLAPNNVEIQRNLKRVLQWQEVQNSEYVPPAKYALPEGFGQQGLPPPPPPLWGGR